MEYDQTVADDMLPDAEPFGPDHDDTEPCESETKTASTSSGQKDSNGTTTTTAISQSTVQQVLSDSEGDDNDIIYVAPPSSNRSLVWKHFGFFKQREVDVVRQDETCCKHCKTSIYYHATGDTTNMIAHLSRVHSIKIEPTASIIRKAEDTTACKAEASQPKMTLMLKLKEGLPLHKTMTESLVRYRCMDFQPLSTV